MKKNDRVMRDMMVACCLNNTKVGVRATYEELPGANVFSGV